jgi:predicted small secreted protein
MSHATPIRRALRAIVLVAASAAALSLAACNTVKGVGRDIENAGEAGQRVLDGD